MTPKRFAAALFIHIHAENRGIAVCGSTFARTGAVERRDPIATRRDLSTTDMSGLEHLVCVGTFPQHARPTIGE